MAQVIVEVYRGIIDGLHSNSMGDLHVRIFDSDDKNDTEHNHIYAACNYAINYDLNHGGMVDHMNIDSDDDDDERHLMENPLKRLPKVLELIAADNQVPLQDGGDRQQLDAAFAAGYLQAIGELNSYLRRKVAYRIELSREAYQFLSPFIDRQYDRYFDFCEEINSPSKYVSFCTTGDVECTSSKGGATDDENS